MSGNAGGLEGTAIPAPTHGIECSGAELQVEVGAATAGPAGNESQRDSPSGSQSQTNTAVGSSAHPKAAQASRGQPRSLAFGGLSLGSTAGVPGPAPGRSTRSMSSLHTELSGGGTVVVMSDGGNGRLATTFNLANGVVGPVLLVCPNAYQMCGWVTAAVFAVMAMVACGSTLLITKCMKRTAELLPEEDRKGEPLDWPLLGQAALGPPGRLLVKSIWMTALYLLVVFGLVLNMTNLHILFPQVRSTWLIGSVGIAAFISLYVPPRFLEYFSFMGIAVTLLVLAAVLTSGLELPELPEAQDYKVVQPGSLVTVATTALLCYDIHLAIPSIHLAMKEKARPSFGKVSVAAFSMALLIYGSLGAIGYYFFANATQANIAQNIGLDLSMEPIPHLGFLRLVLAALIIVKVQVTFPLFSGLFLSAVEAALPLKGWAANSSGIIFKVLFLLITTLPAILLEKHVDDLVSLAGAISGTSMEMIFPALFTMLLFRTELRAWQFALLGMLFAGGVYIQVMGTWRSLSNIIHGY